MARFAPQMEYVSMCTSMDTNATCKAMTCSKAADVAIHGMLFFVARFSRYGPCSSNGVCVHVHIYGCKHNVQSNDLQQSGRRCH
eukprot:4635808-Amphidinium_carterae.1